MVSGRIVVVVFLLLVLVVMVTLVVSGINSVVGVVFGGSSMVVLERGKMLYLKAIPLPQVAKPCRM